MEVDDAVVHNRYDMYSPDRANYEILHIWKNSSDGTVEGLKQIFRRGQEKEIIIPKEVIEILDDIPITSGTLCSNRENTISMRK